MPDQTQDSKHGRLREMLTRLAELTGEWRPSERRYAAGGLTPLSWLLLLGLVGACVISAYLLLAPDGSRSLVALLVVLLLGCLALAALVARQVHLQLVVPMNALYRWALQMCDGDLSARIPPGQRGQFAKLTFHVNRLSEALERLANEMDDIVGSQTESLRQKNASLEALFALAQAINAPGSIAELLERSVNKLMDILDAHSASVDIRQGDGSLQRLHELRRKARSFDDQTSAVIDIPLRYRDEVLGQVRLQTGRSSKAAHSDDDMLLQSVGKHLGMAVAKARLEREAHQLSLMRERSTLAHELHDSLAQTLAGLRFQVQMLAETLSTSELPGAKREIRRIQQNLNEAHNELRELISNFRAPVDERRLIPALEGLVARLRSEAGIAAYLHAECPEVKLAPARELQVLRIVREALTNVRKHAKAETVRVLVRADDDDTYRVLIEDDGIGLTQSTTAAEHEHEHLGLAIMRERTHKLGGTLEIESEPGEGTRIVLCFSADEPALEQVDAGVE